MFFAVDSYRTIPNKNSRIQSGTRSDVASRRAYISNNKINFDRQKAYESRKKYAKENSFYDSPGSPVRVGTGFSEA